MRHFVARSAPRGEIRLPPPFAVRVRSKSRLLDAIRSNETRAHNRNRVIEAEKEAAANVILRREETAATRSLANTARVIAEQPVLLRLKELDALKEIASRIHEVRVVVGADGLKTLLPAGLLGPANGNANEGAGGVS
jgi:hypothetical protein